MSKAKFHTNRAVTAAFWLPFLLGIAAPIVAGSSSHAETVAGLTLVAIFGIADILALGYVDSVARGGAATSWLFWLLVFGIIAVAIYCVSGPAALGLLPYFAALIGSSAPPRTAALTMGGILIFCALVPLVDRSPEAWVSYATMVAVCVLVGTGVGRQRARDERQELASELALAHQRERIYRDVHDLLGHSLTVINLQASLARTRADEPEVREQLDSIVETSRTALDDVRRAVRQTHAPSFAAELDRACAALSTAGIVVRTDVRDPIESPLLGWVLREAVTNVIRHSGAGTCTIAARPGKLRVTDDGRGLPAGARLRAISQRVDAAGAVLEVGPAADDVAVTDGAAAGRGTTVEVFERD